MVDNNLYIGIDPGGSGSISVLCNNEWTFHEIPKVGKVVDLHALSQIFQLYSENPQSTHCAIEDVHALFGSGAGSTFSFGFVCGAIEAMLHAWNIPFTKVQPKAWQKEMWQGVPLQKKLSSSKKTMVNDTKLMSEIAAKRLFPTIDLRRNTKCKNNDDNKIDSILICEYIRRKINGKV